MTQYHNFVICNSVDTEAERIIERHLGEQESFKWLMKRGAPLPFPKIIFFQATPTHGE